jgi:tetratricopeptide (TPR) repeat protein
MRMLRMFALAEAQFGSGFDLRADWEGFLRIREQVHKSNPRLESLAYSWLGDQLSKQQPLIFLGGRGKETSWRDPQGSCECLEKAIRLDPENLEAHLRLAKVYESLKRGSERNRLLDEMAKRFSQEKLVLLENARGCIERKAFTKALDLLGRARQVDRLDPVIPELTVVARRRLAREQYQQHRPDKGRNTLAPIEEFLTDKPEDFQRSRWAAWLRHGLLEQLFGDAAQGAALLGQARAASPFPAAFLLFAHLTYRRYADPPQNSSPFLAELRTELKRDPSAAAGALLMRIFQYWDGTPDNPPLGTERDMLRNYLNVAAKRPFTRAEVRAVLELCPPDQFEKQAAAFVKGVLRKDPGDPLFRLFDYMLHPTWFLDSEESRRKLRPILEEARRRDDQELVQKLQGLLRSLEHPPAMPVSPADGALDGDQDIELEEDFGQGPGADPMKPMLPAELAGFTELIEMLANASEAEVRRMRKTRPKGIPNFIFDMLVEAAKRGGPTSPLMPLPHPGPSKALGPRPTPQEDPNQRQLF